MLMLKLIKIAVHSCMLVSRLINKVKGSVLGCSHKHSGSRKPYRFVENFIRNSEPVKIILTSTFTDKNISYITQNMVPIKPRCKHM